MRVGIQLAGDEESPPARALANRKLAAQVRGYMTDGAHSPGEIVMAVGRRDIDVAAVWGPIGGYYASRVSPPLAVHRIVASPRDQLPFAFDIAMQAAPGHDALLASLNALLQNRHHEITGVLQRFHVPTVDREATTGPITRGPRPGDS
jgi:hypothetical protein